MYLYFHDKIFTKANNIIDKNTSSVAKFLNSFFKYGTNYYFTIYKSNPPLFSISTIFSNPEKSKNFSSSSIELK
jgi:hypothetical protein